MPSSRSTPGRIHLLPAKQSPKVVILRRKPTKWTHVMLWDTSNDAIEHGSWFKGGFEMLRSDLSFDGTMMVYGARNNSTHQQWTGVCRPPWLETLLEFPGSLGSTGGYWDEPDSLRVPNPGRYGKPADLMSVFEKVLPSYFGTRQPAVPEVPVRISKLQNVDGLGYLPPALVRRLERDGWHRAGPLPREFYAFGVKHKAVSDPGWSWRFSPDHPELRMFYRGMEENFGHLFEFSLPEMEDVLDEDVQWATWTCEGDLVLARGDVVQRYNLQDLRRGTPSFEFDLSGSTPPPARKPDSL